MTGEITAEITCRPPPEERYYDEEAGAMPARWIVMIDDRHFQILGIVYGDARANRNPEPTGGTADAVRTATVASHSLSLSFCFRIYSKNVKKKRKKQTTPDRDESRRVCIFLRASTLGVGYLRESSQLRAAVGRWIDRFYCGFSIVFFRADPRRSASAVRSAVSFPAAACKSAVWQIVSIAQLMIASSSVASRGTALLSLSFLPLLPPPPPGDHFAGFEPGVCFRVPAGFISLARERREDIYDRTPPRPGVHRSSWCAGNGHVALRSPQIPKKGCCRGGRERRETIRDYISINISDIAEHSDKISRRAAADGDALNYRQG